MDWFDQRGVQISVWKTLRFLTPTYISSYLLRIKTFCSSVAGFYFFTQMPMKVYIQNYIYFLLIYTNHYLFVFQYIKLFLKNRSQLSCRMLYILGFSDCFLHTELGLNMFMRPCDWCEYIVGLSLFQVMLSLSFWLRWIPSDLYVYIFHFAIANICKVVL